MLSLLAGILIGFSLGLTGGGGSILAVPILVYAIGVSPHEAVVISLAAVGATALIGSIGNARRGTIDLSAGLIFAVGGIAGAPIGTRFNVLFDDAWLLLCFAILMLMVAARMARSAQRHWRAAHTADAEKMMPPLAQRKRAMRIAVLVIAGLVAGVLSGLFGVGGGFIIVPALMIADRMAIHMAVGTSLLIIAIISASGVFSHILIDNVPNVWITLFFVLGGAIGLIPAGYLVQKISPIVLQVIFASGISVLAVFIIAHTVAMS